MKQRLIILLLACSYWACGQNWCLPGASWYYNVTCVGGGGYNHYYYSGDSVINGIACKGISGIQHFESSFVTTYSLGTTYTYASGDTVYYFRDTAFLPYLYFNARVGDTIKMPNLDSFLLAIIDSNGKKLVNEDSLRYYWFHLINYCDTTLISEKIVERLGPIYLDLFPTWGSCTIDANCGGGLTCYSDDSFPLYNPHPQLPCYDSTLSINKVITADYINIKPNPATQYIMIIYNLTSPNTNQPDLVISNIIGQMVYTQPLRVNSNQQQIDISRFASGMYTVYIKRGNAVVAMRKLVVTH